MAQQNNDIKYLTPIAVDTKKKKYCRFKKARIKYIDYKDPNFLLEIRERAGKNSSPPTDRNFNQIPEKSSSGCKKVTSPEFDALRS